MKDMLEKYTNYGRTTVRNKNGQIGGIDGDGDDENGGNAQNEILEEQEELEPEREIAILAFPTNDFHQETGTNDDIGSVVKKLLGDQYHNPNFVLFHKSKLAHNPVYKKLKEHMPEAEVKHNFYKYLVGRDGVPVGFYKKKTSLYDMESAMVEELEMF